MAEVKKQSNGKAPKARRPSALKRDLQGEKRNLRNRSFKAKVGTAVRVLNESISKKENASLPNNLSSVFSLMDKGVKKGVFSPNKANRVKSRLAAASKKA